MSRQTRIGAAVRRHHHLARLQAVVDIAAQRRDRQAAVQRLQRPGEPARAELDLVAIDIAEEPDPVGAQPLRQRLHRDLHDVVRIADRAHPLGKLEHEIAVVARGAQRALGQLAVGDVERYAHEAGRLAVLVLFGAALRVDPHP